MSIMRFRPIGNGNVALSVAHGHWDFRQEISDDLKRSTGYTHIKVKERKRKNMQKSRR